MKYTFQQIADMISRSGKFEILPDGQTGRYTLTENGKTVTADIDIDTFSFGIGLDKPEDARQYEGFSNPMFCEACQHIAEQLSAGDEA